MAEKRQFPTPEMLKAREELAKMTPEERQLREDITRAELKKYYENHPSAGMRRAALLPPEEN